MYTDEHTSIYTHIQINIYINTYIYMHTITKHVTKHDKTEHIYMETCMHRSRNILEKCFFFD